ncbi:MAG: serine hydrolase [Chloroflexota bacterium]|nr:serine hydrolase [Chloroflexota bacterium]
MHRFVNFVLILVALLAIFPIYTRYKVAAAPVPPGVHLGGLDLSDLKDAAEIRRHLESIYAEPISLHYEEARLVLRPEDIDFHVDVEQMVTEAMQYLEGSAFLDIAVRHALGIPQQRRDVPVRFMLDAGKLRAQLEAIAAEYDHGPQGARVLPPTSRWAEGAAASAGLPAGYVGSYTRDWTWTAGRPGYTLDVEASIPLVIAALTRETDRDVSLALIETPAPPLSLDDLARELDSATSNFPGFAAIYVHDLVTDEEATIDADVSFSGMSTLKIGLAAAIMRKLDNGLRSSDGGAELVGQWLDYALGESNNYAANQLLSFLGDGDVAAGTREFTEFMRSLGFVNTYMQSGYDAQVQLPQIPTPGNQRTDWETNPDSNLQSTPAEMGRILSAIYQCTLGEGVLVERYPDEITPDECSAILFYMSHDEFQELIWAGLPHPADAWIVHKHGFAFESHSDVALVWGPSGPYVLSIFLFRKGWMDWGTSNSTMKSISRIVWNFFEQRQDQMQLDAPEPVVLTPPAGYAPIKDEYISVASTGFQ